MDLLGQSRRYFKFDIADNIKFSLNGIKAEAGEIWFPRPNADNWGRQVFETTEDCKYWVERVMNFKSMERIDKKLYNVKSEVLEVTEKDWDLISKYMTNPGRFDPQNGDVKIFESHLANNFKDRDGERFSLPVLKSFSKSIVGKSKLVGHDWRGLGDGRFYKASLKKMTADEAIEFVGSNPNRKFREHLEAIAGIDGAIYWLVTGYYMLNVTDSQQQAVLETEGGLRHDQSIGFRAPKMYAVFGDGTEKEVQRGVFGPDDNELDREDLLYLEYRNFGDIEAEALEGSDVFLGSQYGAGTTKDADSITYVTSGYANLDKEFTIIPLVKTEIKGDKINNKAVWSTALINTFEDNCFAVVEPTGEKDDEGKTVPRNARHLPHHAKGNGASGTGGTIDPAHLRNALARMNQIQPVTDKISVESLRSKAKSHLVAHAKKEGIGDWGEDSVNLNDEVTKMANLKIDLLDVNMTVTEGETFEADLKKAEEAINKSLDNKVEQMDQELTDVKQQRDDAVDDMNAAKEKLTASQEFEKNVKSVFGEESTIEDMKKTKETADAFVKSLVEDVVKYGNLVGMIPKDKIDEKKQRFMSLSVDEIKEWLDQYKQIYEERNLPDGVLMNNADDKNPVNDNEPKPVKVNGPEQAFREPL